MRLSQYFRNRQRSQGRHRFLDQLLQWETAAFSLGWQDARRSLCYAKRAAGAGARPRARSGPGANPTGGMINMIHLSKAAKLSRGWGPALSKLLRAVSTAISRLEKYESYRVYPADFRAGH